MVVAAFLLGAAGWLFPFTTGGILLQTRCVPVVDVLESLDSQSLTPDEAVGVAICHGPAVDHLLLGTFGGALLGIPGVVMIVAANREERRRQAAMMPPPMYQWSSPPKDGWQPPGGPRVG